jgi:hypothetical protein
MYDLSVSRRRLKRIKAARTPRARVPPPVGAAIRTTDRVVRVAYTRSQAAEALGVSRSTFIRRVLPYIETVRMPWGAILVPADELDRLLSERRRKAVRGAQPTRPSGRPAAIPKDVVERIRRDRARGLSFGRIAKALNEDGTPTSHGGVKWWPSTVRSVVTRRGPRGADGIAQVHVASVTST